MARASAVCRRLMSISGVGQVTALAFAGAIDDSSTFVDRIGDTFRWKGENVAALERLRSSTSLSCWICATSFRVRTIPWRSARRERESPDKNLT